MNRGCGKTKSRRAARRDGFLAATLRQFRLTRGSCQYKQIGDALGITRARLRLTPAAMQVLRNLDGPAVRKGLLLEQVLRSLLWRNQPDAGAALLDAMGIDRGVALSRLGLES